MIRVIDHDPGWLRGIQTGHQQGHIKLPSRVIIKLYRLALILKGGPFVAVGGVQREGM